MQNAPASIAARPPSESRPSDAPHPPLTQRLDKADKPVLALSICPLAYDGRMNGVAGGPFDGVVS